MEPLPRGLVPLKKLFDNNDVEKDPKFVLGEEEVEDCNIGTEKDPKVVKLPVP